MASISVCCPKCEAILKLASQPPEGKKIRCPKCATAFVPADNEVADDANAIKAKPNRPAPAPASKSRKTRIDDDETDESPRSRKPRAEKDDDEDDKPRRSKGKRNPDDDEDEGPRNKGKKKPAGKSGLFLVLGLCAGAGVLLVGVAAIGGGLYWWLSARPAQNQIAKGVAPPEIQPVVKDPGVKPPDAPIVKKEPDAPVIKEQPKIKPKIKPRPEPVAPPPPMPEPQPEPVFVAEPVDLDQALLTKASRATAFLRVERGTQTKFGSGFIVKSSGDTAYVVTSLNVILPPEPGEPKAPAGQPKGFFPGGGFSPKKKGGPAPAPKVSAKITVVLQSGTPEEQILPAEIVAIDEEGDLAAVRIKGVRNIPAPIDVAQEAVVAEDQPVYFFGHRMLKGQAGNPTVVAGKGNIMTLRRDANNEITEVQLAGNMPLGGVGGPVIDSQGRLVGVAIGAVPGKQIGFAIPAGELMQMFKGRLAVGAVLQFRQQGVRTEILGERWVHDRKSNVRTRDVISIPQGNKPKGSPPPPADEFVVLAFLADPMFKISGVKAYYAMTEAVPEAADEMGWPKLTKATPIALEIQDQMAIGPFKLPKGAIADQSFAFQFSYVNADKQTVYTQPHLVRLTFPTSTKSVTINIAGIPDLPTRQYIEDTAASKFNAKVTVKSKTKDGLILIVDPVPDPNALQAKIDFGKVTSAQGRTFEVTANKITLPVPTDDEITKALAALNKADGKQRIPAAEKLGRAYVILPDRRAEVAMALEKATDPKNIWLANPALKALQVWGGPENIPGIAPALDSPFTKAEAFNVLAKFPQEPAAATAMAKTLTDWTSRARASFLLKKMGPTAEKALIPFATHKDGDTAQAACKILAEIGTAECIPALTEASNSTNNNLKGAANEALKAVRSRKGGA